MAKLLLIEQYFYPEGWGGAQIPRDIAIGLRMAGFEVDVLCSEDQYTPMADQTVQNPASFGIGIRRVPRILPGPVHRFKFVRVIWFCCYAFPRLLLSRGVDLYMTLTNPPLIVPTVALVAALRRRPFIIVAQDLYPEALFASGLSSSASWSGRLLQRLFSWSYRRADHVVALGTFMRRRVLAKGVNSQRVHTISNWATGDIGTLGSRNNRLRAEWGLGNHFVVLYSGNLGIVHEFETFLYGVKRAVEAGTDLLAVFIGGGVRLPEVRALVSHLDLNDRVLFKDFVPADVLPFSLAAADLALVTLRAGFEGVVVPSKLLGYMARGVPVLYVGPDSDVAEMIRDADCGACCAPGDSPAVAEVLARAARDRALLERWGQHARECYSNQFARERGLERYVELVRGALARAPS